MLAARADQQQHHGEMISDARTATDDDG